MKNFNDTFGNRTRDLPAFSAGPQPTAPPCAPLYSVESHGDFSEYWNRRNVERKGSRLIIRSGYAIQASQFQMYPIFKKVKKIIE